MIEGVIEGILGSVKTGIQAYSAKREADKARNQQRDQLRADAAFAEKQASLVKGAQPGQANVTTGTAFAQYLPIVIIGGIAVLGVTLLRRD